MSINETLAANIKQLAADRNVSVKEVLESTGINKGFVQELTSKQASPSVDKIIKLANYFNVSLDYLVFGVQENKTLEIIELLKPDIKKAAEE